MLNQYGNTPLHLAAYMGHTEIVELLEARGAEINNGNDSTPSQADTPHEHTEVADQLSEKQENNAIMRRSEGAAVGALIGFSIGASVALGCLLLGIGIAALPYICVGVVLLVALGAGIGAATKWQDKYNAEKENPLLPNNENVITGESTDIEPNKGFSR